MPRSAYLVAFSKSGYRIPRALTNILSHPQPHCYKLMTQTFATDCRCEQGSRIIIILVNTKVSFVKREIAERESGSSTNSFQRMLRKGEYA